MFSIKSSFADCSKCELLEEKSCILETNCRADLSKVELLIIAENPGKDEVKSEKPLKGKAGKTFRKYFEKFNLNKLPYLITNVVLCQTIDKETGNTINPTEEVIERCKVNCFEIIKICDPKLIVVMGASGAKAFGIIKKGGGGITSLRGKTFEWNNKKIFLTVHPSFVNRNRSYETVYEEDFSTISQMMGQTIITTSSSAKENKLKGNKQLYKIPDKYYTDEYRLIDVQYLSRTNEVLYIFRDKDNKKYYYRMEGLYYYYKCKDGIEPMKIVSYDDLDAFEISYKEKDLINHTEAYEGDLKIQDKHAIDYYIQNKGEAVKIYNNIMFCDIEIDTGEAKEFPRPEDAKYPINMISIDYNNKKITYVLDNHTDEIKNYDDVELKIFEKEKSLMVEFIKDFKIIDPDIISGWNFISFDIHYIFNRLPKIGISQSDFSRFGNFYVDPYNYRVNLPGIVCLDQDYLYKMFTFTKKENYKLGNIAQEELGETKVELPHSINEMYWKDINLTIKYNIKDTDLLVKLENKLGHINLLNEIRQTCNITFASTVSSFHQIDGLTVSFLKRKDKASKDANQHISKEKYPGAFVREPSPGVYNWITDFDFTSLYPSIIMTYNIGVNNFIMRLKDSKLGYYLTYDRDKLPEKIDVITNPTYERKEITLTKEELLKKIEDENLIFTINGCFFLNHKDYPSIYSEIVTMLMSSRKEYKSKMLEAKENKKKDETSFFNTRQLVMKTISNTLYGIIANKIYRFFDISCASAITLSGQEALKSSIINADKYMESLRNKSELVKPKVLTEVEMYSDSMPLRKTPYIVTGDTDSIFCCFEDFENVNEDDIQQYCNKVQTFLNEDIIIDVVKKHNVLIENNKLELKNELIISRGLFLAKKRYCIHVIKQEGKIVDEILSMGLETKRSDFPRKTKEFLNELIEMILKSEKVSLKKLMQYIKQKEVEFIKIIKSGDKQISKPVSFGKKVKDYKVIPQAVRGMLNWNNLFYESHYPGMKAYQFKVAGIDDMKAPKEILENYQKNFLAKGKKIDVIAIPDEIEKLPDYIIPDVKDMLRFIFTDRYELLLDPLINLKNKKIQESMLF